MSGKHKALKTRKPRKVPSTVFLTEDQFDGRYFPMQSPEGSSWWEYEQTLSIGRDYVWSILEIDGVLYAIPGYHVVNVIGYHVTTKPWPHDLIEVRFDAPDVGLDILD